VETTLHQQALAWATEIIGSPNVAEFWIPEANFVSAVRTLDSVSFTRSDGGLYGLGLGPNPVISPDWQRFSISQSVQWEVSPDLKLTTRWSAYVIESRHCQTAIPVARIDDDAIINDFLEQHAPDSSVFPGNPVILFWVVIKSLDDQIAALGCLTEWESGEKIISSVATAAHLRGQGYAQRLVAGMVRNAFDLGINQVGLGVMSENLPARKVYEKVGFTLMGDFNYFER
jgi:RimJ/RimL family protein N-acetyltransferase